MSDSDRPEDTFSIDLGPLHVYPLEPVGMDRPLFSVNGGPSVPLVVGWTFSNKSYAILRYLDILGFSPTASDATEPQPDREPEPPAESWRDRPAMF